VIQIFNWLRRGSLERGLDRELQYHFDRRVADLTAAGIPEPEARRRVAVELAGAAISSTISASPPDRSSAAPASPPPRCSRWP
jgi:hypothetical protein